MNEIGPCPGFICAVSYEAPCYTTTALSGVSTTVRTVVRNMVSTPCSVDVRQYERGDSLSGDQDNFPGSLAPFETLVNLGGFIKRVLRDLDLEAALRDPFEKITERARHMRKTALQIETTQCDVLLD